MVDLDKIYNIKRKELENSTICACFYCCEVFRFKDIKAWTDSGETAICPYCHIDSVIGNSTGLVINQGFLRKVMRKCFG